jgi:hypothetical protein
MPAVQELVQQLISVKNDVWTAQSKMATSANTVCDRAYPSQRAGGAAKCCTAMATVSDYEPAGYNGCTAGDTMSPQDPNTETTASKNLHFLHNEGWHYDGDKPSTMPTDCCRTTSTCATNDITLNGKVDVAEGLMGTLHQDVLAMKQKIDAVNIEVSLEVDKIAENRASIKKICEISTDTQTLGEVLVWPSTLAEAVATGTHPCVGGSVTAVIEEEASRQATLKADAASFSSMVPVIKRVIAWLDNEGSSLFKLNLHTDAPTIEDATTNAPGVTAGPSVPTNTMVSLLEGVAKSTTNTNTKLALSKAVKLIEGAKRGTGTQVIALLQQILSDMESSNTKVLAYALKSQQDSEDQISNSLAELSNKKKDRDIQMLHKAQLMDSISTYMGIIKTKDQSIQEQKEQWVIHYKDRQINAGKCISYMKYFDAETQTNTKELLVLKKTIDIIKHIGCGTTSAPTTFPTSFPTTSPTKATLTPTAFPTRAPTANPTNYPTLAPTTGHPCTKGAWKFQQKVYQAGAQYAIPPYTDGTEFAIDTDMSPGTCITHFSNRTNVEGAEQQVEHQYKCCGNNGLIYGAISEDSMATSKQLCAADAADHCGLFGGNMYKGANSTDPTWNTIVTGLTLAPTTDPTAFPTRSPTVSPTAFPTKAPTSLPTAAPTKAPTDSPTALAYNAKAWYDRDDKGSTLKTRLKAGTHTAQDLVGYKTDMHGDYTVTANTATSAAAAV